MTDRVVAPWVRVFILIVGTLTVALLSYKHTGNVLPSDPKQSLIFQNALLLIIIGSAILEPYYTKPADSVVNSLMGIISLLPVYGLAPKIPWMIVAGYCSLVLIAGLVCMFFGSQIHDSDWTKVVNRITFQISTVFGRAKVLFTLIFLGGLWFFYDIQDKQTLSLLIFWGVFLAIWPLKLPELITKIFTKDIFIIKNQFPITRIDSPNLIRAKIEGSVRWSNEKPMVCCLPNGDKFWVQPLFSRFFDGESLATLLITELQYENFSLPRNIVSDPNPKAQPPTMIEINQSLGGGSNARLVGFVIENSKIDAIQFEKIDSQVCHEGMLVWVNVGSDSVYYQIVEGQTGEENFSGEPHGYHEATAIQLGILESEKGFKKYSWLPNMNSPVFASLKEKELTGSATSDQSFILGEIPHSKIRVGGKFRDNFNYHTAILGVTGSGKTELGFDLIRHSIENNLVVVCIDLTAQYTNRLSDLNPVSLSIDSKTANDLSQKLFDVDSGNFGASEEKKVLKDFSDKLVGEIKVSVEEFFKNCANGDLDKNIAIIALQELSNTKASLLITEMYMSRFLEYARKNYGEEFKLLIVVEEAHTVMPEPSTMGVADYDSRGLVGKISQIALQGRKYGVGLLVLAQRTATVSKTVLTQCNTIISFACYDDTSLGFLKNIFGGKYTSQIPNLPSLRGIAFGKWVDSENPIIFDVPYDPQKGASHKDVEDKMSEDLLN